jgi:disulfide bond formation protein DsbB
MKNCDFYLLRLGFALSVIATTGSLYFSEVMKLPPCVLCWYQRICMYPLVVLFGICLSVKDKKVRDVFHYALGLISVGTGIALYHNLLYYGIIPDSITPCTQGISCTARQIEWLGFITIPLLSLVSFSLLFIISALVLKQKKANYEKQ